MFGSAFLEVIIGITFVYVLLSIVCSALNEMIAQVFKMRGKALKEGVKRLLTDKTIRARFYEHPLIRSLGREPKNGGVVMPSYIPPRIFALALIDTIAPAGQKKEEKPDPEDSNKTIPVYAAIRNLTELRDTVVTLDNKDLRTVLLSLIETSNKKIEEVYKNVEDWFNLAMDRVSGWYKRKIRWIMLCLAFMVTGIMNADTITLVSSLWQEPVLRQEIVTTAASYARATENIKEKRGYDDAKSSQEALEQQINILKKLNLPFGWSEKTLPDGVSQWIWKVMGLIFTSLAVSLGAPFWFDLLNKFVNLRGTGTVPEKSGKTS